MDIAKMEQQARELAEQIATAKAEQAKREREARMAAQKAEQDNHIERMFTEYAEPFGVPRAVADKVYSLAYTHGHSSGLADIENYYQDFAELARVAYETGYTEGRVHAGR